MKLDILLLQAGADAGMIQMIFFGGIILVFWLFFIRPQAKKQKQQNTFMESLEKGDDVVTASGIIGRINKIEENNIIQLEVGTKTYIRVTRNAISREMTESVFKPEDN